MPFEKMNLESAKSEAKKASERSLTWLALIWIVVGLSLLLADISLELYSKQTLGRPSKAVPGSAPMVNSNSAAEVKIEFAALGERLLEAVGIASVVFGMFSLFLELSSLRRYFLERMKELVVDEVYLDTLDERELLKLQTNALKAHFRNTDIDREGRFLGFLSEHIYPYINDPYRERVTLEIRYEEEPGGLLVAKDRLSYICRKSKDSIISSIIWHNDPGEIKDVRSLKVSVRYPDDRDGGLGEFKTIGELKGDEIWVANREGDLIKRADQNKSSLLGGEGLRINVGESYKNIDGVKVIIDADYVVESTHLLYWSMNYPTKDFSLTLRFPKSYVVQAATFINSSHAGELARERGYYSFTYNSWMIPQSGVAWRLISVEGQDALPN